MEIKVKLKGYLVRYFDGDKERIIKMDDGLSIKEAVKNLGLDPHSKKFGFVAVNGQRSNIEEMLVDGDELKIYPRMSGG